MKVLFVCRNNAYRSQIAEAIFNRLSRLNKTSSAGVEVDIEGSQSMHATPSDIKNMEEIGYDISGCTRTQLTRELVNSADKIFTMVPKDTLPAYVKTSKKVVYWPVEDPDGKVTRDKIKKLVETLVKEIG